MSIILRMIQDLCFPAIDSLPRAKLIFTMVIACVCACVYDALDVMILDLRTHFLYFLYQLVDFISV